MNGMYSSKLAPVVLRIALSLVFLLFGIFQLTNIDAWKGYVPDIALNFGLSAVQIVTANALLELALGTLLLLGLFTRISALMLSLHLFGIAFSLGWNDLAVRDFGLAFATLAVFLHGPDHLCLDMKFRKSNSLNTE